MKKLSDVRINELQRERKINQLIVLCPRKISIVNYRHEYFIIN